MIPARPKVVIVEDEVIVATQLRKRLETMGYTVPAIASSGREALRKIAAVGPDVILMDIVLKEKMTGIEVAERIRAQFHIPVIFLTAYGDAETLSQAKQTTPFGYLLKPFDSDTLRANIEIALYRQTQETAKRRRSRPQRCTVAEAAMKLGQSKKLTDRELATLELLANGLSIITIATIQRRSTNTVKFHLRNTYRKLNVTGRSDLLRLLR